MKIIKLNNIEDNFYFRCKEFLEINLEIEKELSLFFSK